LAWLGVGAEAKAEGKLLPFESSAGFNKGVDGEVQADQSEDTLNRGPLMVGKMVFVILAHQGRCSKNGEKHKYQSGGLEPEGVKRSAYGNKKRFPAGKDRIEQAVFLYNALQSIFNCGNLRHFPLL
jgi:hypothetical protein